MARFSARTYLLGLIAVAIIPVWIFVAFLLLSYAFSEQREYRDQAVQIARQSAIAVDGTLSEMLIRLDGLARSFDSTRADFSRLHADARRMVADTGRVVSLRDLGQTQLLRTDTQYDAPLPNPRVLSAEELRDFREGRERISDVVIDESMGPVIMVARPIQVAGTIYLLEMTISTADLGATLQGTIPKPWVVGVGDRDGVYVTRSERHDDVTGKPGLPEYLNKAKGAEGTFTSDNQFGDTLLAGYVRSKESGWLYAANVDLAIVEGPLWQSIYSALGLAAIALAGSLMLAYMLGRALTRETAGLVKGALALGSREPVVPVESHLKEFSLINSALIRAEGMLHERTQELEAVLATAPVAVWFTYDQAAREVVRNRFAAELMGLRGGSESHFGRPDQVIATLAYKNGKPVSRDDRPLSRAMRGEHTDGEEYSYVLLNGEKRELMTSARPIFDHARSIVGAVQVSMDITDRKRNEEQLHLLARELNHRVKNNLAIVQAIAQQTLRHSATLDEARHALVERLSALGNAHEILTRNEWVAGSVRDIVEGGAVTQAPGRIFFDGPDVGLRPNLVMSLSLALHELGTNALKYGALSNASGTVHISWERISETNRLVVVWKEQGGPSVAQPKERGFGTRLLERLTTGEGGTLELSFDPPGVTAKITLPLS